MTCSEDSLKHILDFLDTEVQYSPFTRHKRHSDRSEGYTGSIQRCVVEEIKLKLEKQIVKLYWKV